MNCIHCEFANDLEGKTIEELETKIILRRGGVSI